MKTSSHTDQMTLEEIVYHLDIYVTINSKGSLSPSCFSSKDPCRREGSCAYPQTFQLATSRTYRIGGEHPGNLLASCFNIRPPTHTSTFAVLKLIRVSSVVPHFPPPPSYLHAAEAKEISSHLTDKIRELCTFQRIQAALVTIHQFNPFENEPS